MKEDRRVTMTVQSWLIYLTLVFIATSTPGPAVVFIMTNSTLHGWKKSVFSALGNIVDLLFLGIIAISGLGTILKTSVIVFSVLKYAGAAYLVYLGIKMIIQKSSDPSPIDNHSSCTEDVFTGLWYGCQQPQSSCLFDGLVPSIY
jgi:homoserine/homoserine lactone efflux protein